MDELRGPTLQIVLHVKEGIGFGFLRSPFIVTGSLNGYTLDTDPVVPCHAPVFDAELVWEADKRRFRSLRVQNVPIKVEVYSVGTQGRKDKVGYFLLSLLGAQPCPSNKIIDVRHTWHRLLGVKSEGKCCQPQLLISLSIEDRVHTTTPRNELRMFHSNEVAYPSDPTSANLTSRTMLFTMNEYLAESKKTVSTPELQPQLLCDEGLIQVGPGKDLFTLSLVIGGVENLDLLLPDYDANKEAVDCYVTYSVFTHNIQTDRVRWSVSPHGSRALFNQRTSLRLRSSLAALNSYLAECPHLVTRIYAGERDVGICSMDLRKLVPTEDTDKFVRSFCNSSRGLTIHERCFILRCDEANTARDSRRPYVDVEMSLLYNGIAPVQKPSVLTARSATQLDSSRRAPACDPALHNKSGSCTELHQGGGVGGVAYTTMGASNTARYTNAAGDAVVQTNEIAELIRKMYDTFQESQEKLLASKLKPTTSDMQVQCEAETETNDPQKDTDDPNPITSTPRGSVEDEPIPIKVEASKSDTCIPRNGRDLIKLAIPALERNELMQRYVEELEDWKEKQQQLFKCQLKSKEEYHLEMLCKEWARKQSDLEGKLQRGVEQCRQLAADLTRATEDFRLRGFRNTEREKKLLEAKKALESHYSGKYQQLRSASQQLSDDLQHQLALKDRSIHELQLKVDQLEKQVQVLKNNMKNNEKENESRYSGLTKDQTASLIQELRCLEEKLDSAVQSKAFFKEQWGRAVRELHLSKLHTRRQMLTQLQHDRKQLTEMGLDSITDDQSIKQSQVDIKKLKDDFYVDLLANTPMLEPTSIVGTSVPDGIEMFNNIKNTPKNPMNEKLNELIGQRDQLIQQDSPDEGILKQLNYEIRNMLLNCGT